MILTGKAKRDFLHYVYHTKEGPCHIMNNMSIEESASITIANWSELNLQSTIYHWINKHITLGYSVNYENYYDYLVQANELYNLKFTA